MPPKMISHVVKRFRNLSRKTRTEQISAIKATIWNSLVQAGILAKIGSREFRNTVAGNVASASSNMRTVALIEHNRYVKELLADPRYEDKRRLLPSGFKVYSQNDEDGIIQEIFSRIGCESRIFVEFGVT